MTTKINNNFEATFELCDNWGWYVDIENYCYVNKNKHINKKNIYIPKKIKPYIIKIYDDNDNDNEYYIKKIGNDKIENNKKLNTFKSNIPYYLESIEEEKEEETIYEEKEQNFYYNISFIFLSI